MAVTHFRISQNPQRVDLTVDAVPVVVDQVYPIAQQNLLATTNATGIKSAKLDTFKYQLSIDGGITWSNEGTCNVNDFAGTGTPTSANETLTKSSENQSSVPVLPTDANTDRIIILGPTLGNAEVKLSGIKTVANEVVFVYDFANLVIENSLGGGEPYDEIEYQCGNHLGINSATTYKITLNATLLAELLFVQRTLLYSNEIIGGKPYYKLEAVDTISISKAYIFKVLAHTVEVLSPMLTQSVYNSISVDEEVKISDQNFLFYKDANDIGKAEIIIRHTYVDYLSQNTSSQVTITLDSVDADLAKVSLINEHISSLAITGLTTGAVGTVTEYRSSYESNGYIYAGYLDETTIVIKRSLDGVITNASGLTDLETDFTNRFNLTYS